MLLRSLGVLVCLCSCTQNTVTSLAQDSHSALASKPPALPQSRTSCSNFPTGKFGVGSTRATVSRSAPKPKRTYEGSTRTVWYFDDEAEVTFKNGVVTEWSNPKGQLPVAVSSNRFGGPGQLGATNPLGKIAESASMANVHNLAGIPNKVSSDGSTQRWHYGPSRLVFRNGRATQIDRRRSGKRSGENYVAAHYRQNGSFVPGHYRTNPDASRSNNYSTLGNINPHTGTLGTRRASSIQSSAPGRTYVRPYTRSDGTSVSGHYRKR